MRNEPPSRPVENEALTRLMGEVFAAGGTFRFKPTGRSMLPTLRERRDTVTLCSPAQRPPQKYEVILYRRAGGQAVLHRIIGRDAAGWILCGDHQAAPEHGVSPEAVLGVLCSFSRAGREVSADAPLYRAYARVWVFLRPVRGVCYRVRRRLARMRNSG